MENNIENTLAQIESLEEMIEKRLKPLLANIPKDDKGYDNSDFFSLNFYAV